MPWTVLRDEPGKAAARRALDRESSYIITDILSDNTARAAAFGLNSPFHLPFPFAAKTGTTKDYRDNWALGYTPDWTVGVWVGNFDGKPMRRVSGISGAGPILRDAAIEMERRFGSRPFSRPVGIREVEVCPDSGELPGSWCRDRIREVFSVRNLPRRICTLHRPPAAAPPPARPALDIEFPKPGDVFKIDPTVAPASQSIRLRAAGTDDEPAWLMDGRRLAAQGASVWWRLEAGRHCVVAAARRGRSAPVCFVVAP
jgi:penicillin-binding protein 1C